MQIEKELDSYPAKSLNSNQIKSNQNFSNSKTKIRNPHWKKTMVITTNSHYKTCYNKWDDILSFR